MQEPLVVPYRELGMGGARPYLFLYVRGLDGPGRLISGLIDSGADNTVLPAGYAPLLGYSRVDLVSEQGTQVGGSVALRRATKPSKAHVPEFPRWFSTSPRSS
jgi:hypothetical protein